MFQTILILDVVRMILETILNIINVQTEEFLQFSVWKYSMRNFIILF